MHGSLSQFKATLARKAERDQKRNARNDRNTSSKGEKKSAHKKGFPQFSTLEVEQAKTAIKQELKAEKNEEVVINLVVLGIILSVFLAIIFLLYKE